MRWKSIVVWPQSVSLDNVEGETTDTHKTKAEAEWVVMQLQSVGLGGKGLVFPISTRVEPCK